MNNLISDLFILVDSNKQVISQKIDLLKVIEDVVDLESDITKFEWLPHHDSTITNLELAVNGDVGPIKHTELVKTLKIGDLMVNDSHYQILMTLFNQQTTTKIGE